MDPEGVKNELSNIPEIKEMSNKMDDKLKKAYNVTEE